GNGGHRDDPSVRERPDAGANRVDGRALRNRDVDPEVELEDAAARHQGPHRRAAEEGRPRIAEVCPHRVRSVEGLDRPVVAGGNGGGGRMGRGPERGGNEEEKGAAASATAVDMRDVGHGATVDPRPNQTLTARQRIANGGWCVLAAGATTDRCSSTESWVRSKSSTRTDPSRSEVRGSELSSVCSSQTRARSFRL